MHLLSVNKKKNCRLHPQKVVVVWLKGSFLSVSRIKTQSRLNPAGSAPLFSTNLIKGFLFVCSGAGVSGATLLTGENLGLLGGQNCCVEPF